MLAQRNEPRGDELRGRITVLHLAQPVEGGVARVVTDLAGAQVRAGLRVVVGCPGNTPLARAAAAVGATTLHWPASREPGPRTAAEVRRAGRLIRQAGPDLVHAHSAKAGLAARLALRGRLPTVYQPHAWSFEAAGGRTARAARSWEQYAARWADRVLCVSEAERFTGVRNGVPGRWAVVRNGVDTDRFTAPPPSAPAHETRRLACRARLAALRGVPSAAPLVVCVGRLCEQKGQRTLLGAWPRLAARMPGVRLALVGDGPDRERLRRLAPHGTVFAGDSDEVDRWYAAADVVVLPSRWEGMALTPLEAMACGRPVVVSDVDGARELLPPGQEDACLVPPGDADALADALFHLVRDPHLRTHLGEVAMKHVRAEFDVRSTTEAVLRMYRELLRATTAAGWADGADRAGRGEWPDGTGRR